MSGLLFNQHPLQQNPECFQAFQDALSKDGNWKDNIGELLNQKMSDPQNEIKSHDESEDK